MTTATGAPVKKSHSVRMPKPINAYLGVPEVRLRKCLRCRKEFRSQGYLKHDIFQGPFLCSRCNTANSELRQRPLARSRRHSGMD